MKGSDNIDNNNNKSTRLIFFSKREHIDVLNRVFKIVCSIKYAISRPPPNTAPIKVFIEFVKQYQSGLIHQIMFKFKLQPVKLRSHSSGCEKNRAKLSE